VQAEQERVGERVDPVDKRDGLVVEQRQGASAALELARCSFESARPG
jgi:hypothetical protein